MQSKKILIVEDEAPLLRALVDKFTLEGFETIAAEDGKSGITIALKEHPDIILLDLLLPKMDGVTVMKKIREDAWGKHVPIIVLTNVSGDDKIMREVLKNEPAYYLIKTDWRLLDSVVEKVKERLGLKT